MDNHYMFASVINESLKLRVRVGMYLRWAICHVCMLSIAKSKQQT